MDTCHGLRCFDAICKNGVEVKPDLAVLTLLVGSALRASEISLDTGCIESTSCVVDCCYFQPLCLQRLLEVG